jgi:hypothetical protein
MKPHTYYKRLALAVLLGAATALGAAAPVAAQDDAEMATTAAAEEATTSTASPPALASAAATRALEGGTQFVEGPALDNPPGPGDAFPMDQWGNTD